MMATLKEELKQTRGFVSLEEEVFLNIVRTEEALRFAFAALFRQEGLSFSQYNVLRILRGSPDGLPCGQILERMVSRDSDMTRLLDALDKRGLVSRSRSNEDRRVVVARISKRGLALLDRLDSKVAELNRRQLEHMKQSDLRKLSKLLEAARSAVS